MRQKYRGVLDLGTARARGAARLVSRRRPKPTLAFINGGCGEERQGGYAFLGGGYCCTGLNFSIDRIYDWRRLRGSTGSSPNQECSPMARTRYRRPRRRSGERMFHGHSAAVICGHDVPIGRRCAAGYEIPRHLRLEPIRLNYIKRGWGLPGPKRTATARVAFPPQDAEPHRVLGETRVADVVPPVHKNTLQAWIAHGLPGRLYYRREPTTHDPGCLACPTAR